MHSQAESGKRTSRRESAWGAPVDQETVTVYFQSPNAAPTCSATAVPDTEPVARLVDWACETPAPSPIGTRTARTRTGERQPLMRHLRFQHRQAGCRHEGPRRPSLRSLPGRGRGSPRPADPAASEPRSGTPAVLSVWSQVRVLAGVPGRTQTLTCCFCVRYEIAAWAGSSGRTRTCNHLVNRSSRVFRD